MMTRNLLLSSWNRLPTSAMVATYGEATARSLTRGSSCWVNLSLPRGGGRSARLGQRITRLGPTCRRPRGATSPLRDRGVPPRLARPEGCLASRRSPLRGRTAEPVSVPTGRIAAAASDGRTNPLGHGRLITDSPSRAATCQQPPGRRTNRVLIPGAELRRSHVSGRTCAHLF
jgi:hypothetical protein